MTGFADLFFRSSKTPKEASAGYAFRNTAERLLALRGICPWQKSSKHSELNGSF